MSDSGIGKDLSGAALLEARLARSTLFADTNPHLKTVPTTTNPAPLGFFTFALCGALYMGLLLDWIDHSAVFVIYAFFIFGAGLGELIVGLLEYQRRNVFACNAFLLYSGFWISFAFKGIMIATKVWPPSPKGDQMAFILWGFITLAFWLQTLVLHVALSSLFLALTILFFLLGAEQTMPGIRTGTAAWGLVVCFLAFYNGAADLFIEIYGKEVLPLGHIPKTRWHKGFLKASRHFGPVGTRLFEPPSADDLEAQSPSPRSLSTPSPVK